MNGEYQPLLEPGFYDVEDDGLEQLFVTPFPDPNRRGELLQGLRVLLSVIRRIGINIEVWLDGSFTTEKPDPADIDIAIYYDPAEVQNLDIQDQNILFEIGDTNLSKVRYKCDPYLVPNDRPEWRSYRRGWFGFTRNEEPKGIARIIV